MCQGVCAYKKVLTYFSRKIKARSTNSLISIISLKPWLAKISSRKLFLIESLTFKHFDPDFSSFPYSLDEVEDDFELEHFALSKIDLELRIPVMEHAKRISEHQIDYLASSWSSPKWLKNSNEFNGFGKLKGEAGDKYHKTWANYHVKEIVVNYASPIKPDQPSA
jgi:hypothetical protein